jgi:hypothetical protein
VDFLTFDDLLKTTLAVDASRRLDLLTLINYGAQGGGEEMEKLRKSMAKLADPNFDDTVNPNEGMRGLKSLLRSGKLAKGSKPPRPGL